MSSFHKQIRHLGLLLIVVLLAAFSLLVYWGFERLLHRYVDTRLEAVALTWAALLEKTPALLTDVGREIASQVQSSVPTEERREFREAALSILVLSLDGAVLWKGAAVGPRPPVDRQLLYRVQRGEIVFETIPGDQDVPLRRVSVPLRAQDEVRYLLQVETSLHLMQTALRDLVLLLAAASGLLLAVAWVGIGWLARKALTPVELLSATAQQISDPSQKTRLVLDAPYLEFRRLAQAFNAMMDRLQKVFEAQRRFAADAAHELQTPLTVLKGNLEVAFQKARTADEYREVLIDNLEEVERLIAVSRSLITLAQYAGDRPPVQFQPMALEPMLRDLIANLTVLAEDRHITISFGAEPAPLVLGDEGQLKRLFINLLDNAIRYTPAGGTVTVEVRAGGDSVLVLVRDTGQGIGHEHLPHIFERFYRTDYARARDTGGTGLGLAIVKEIVAAHRGEVGVDSVVGKGSVFTVRLPTAVSLQADGREPGVVAARRRGSALPT